MMFNFWHDFRQTADGLNIQRVVWNGLVGLLVGDFDFSFDRRSD